MKRIRPLMVLLVSLALACMGSTLAFADSESSARAAQSVAVADGNTASTWRDWDLENSTENVGRIWTDKTVQAGDITLTGAGGEKNIAKGDSTFLTALSAISSTSNVTSRTDVPLDIVLVLDASGSMNDAMGRDDSTRRIIALQKVANSFIDEIAKQNSSVSDEAKQHQVSIVKFAGDKTDEVGNDEYKQGQYWYNNSQVMKEMAKCTDGTKDQFKNTINDIKPSGATHADYGFELAQGQSSNRSDAKKIVIFFTDGTPTSYSNFDPSVASAAVSAAKNMKDAGASVYTIGIFSGADPTAEVNSATDENKFMQAASSNYPDATYSSDWVRYSWNFGNRADKSDYYKSATNSDDLKKVFDDISKEIVQGAGYPTDTKEGYEDESGWITFTDQLGDYMQVDGFTTIVFANQVFENPVKTTNGLVDTYVFSGKAGSALYPEGDLSDIDITVTHSADLKTGDKVEVKIPAGLIPLRHFQVNADGTGSVDLTFPIRAFYGSSLKAGVAEAMANPDVDLAAYIESNSADGKVSFLANKWNGGSDGDTVANFTPSKGNSYYYITEDTPIFADEACTQRATAPLQQGKTYYYQRAWYDLEGGSAVQKTRTVSFNSGVVESINGYIASDANSKAYFKAGTPRMTYINELKTAKGEASNQTKTAGTFINPKWAGDQVNVLLGNNGKLSVSQPGTLAVSKTVEVPDGYNVADFADESFEFTVSVPDAKSTTLKAQVKNVEGENVGSEFDVAFDENGEAKHSLKHGETLYLYGLSSGSAYTVTETPKAGFTQTSPADEASATGAIEAGKTSNADFVNKYEASGTLEGYGNLEGEKTLTGRAWLSEDKFAFLLKAVDDSAPMPEGASDGVIKMEMTQSEGTPAGQSMPFHFGNITYTKPGTYIYEIHESAEDSNILPGVSTSNALYQVTVTVADNDHNGTLTVNSEMEKLKDDAGAAVSGESQQTQVASFVNQYHASNGEFDTANAQLKKVLEGRDWLEDDSFEFGIKAITEGAPMPTDANGNVVSEATVNKGNASSFGFGTIKFTSDDLNGAGSKTFEYEVSEVAGTIPGIDYAANKAIIKVTVVDNGKGKLTASATTENGTFVNRYNAEISYTAAGGLNVAKTLNGRDMTNGQFEIKVTPADEASADALNLPTGGKIISMPASADGVQVAKQVLDGDVVFRQNDVGKTYTYKVAEQGAAPNGYTYDTAERTVAITVADNPSAAKLVVTTTVSGGPEGTKTFTYGSDEAAVATVPFVNSYKAEGGLTEGIAGTKVLSGRNLAEGEFTFAVKYAAGGDDLLTAQNAADGSIAFGKLSYSTELLAQLVKDGKATKNSDGSWTVRYAAYEKTDGLAAVGVTAQTQPIAFTVKVVDNGDGTLTATPNLGDGLKFENAYNADAVSVGLSGVKMLEAEQGLKPADITGKFTFTVTGEDGAPMPERTLAKNDAAGKVDFGTITFTLDSLNKALEQSKPVTQSAEEPAANAVKNDSAAVATDGASAQVAAASNGAAGAAAQNGGSTAKASEPAAQAGTPRSHVFTYKITESGSASGVTNDPVAAKTVSFKVTDDGNGKLTVARVDPADASKPAFAFTNTYSVEPVSSSVTDQIAVTKQLTGRDLAAGEFSFELIEAGNVVATGSNDAEGNVVLGAISYSKPGTHNYTLREVDAGTQQAGVTYDGTVYNVTTTVTDNGDGVLSVAHKLDGGVAAATFSNVYSPAPTSATLGAAKILKGKSLEADEFTFVLTGEDGSKMTAKNDANGNVAFGELKFVEQGTYHYTVAEEKGSEAGVTYDETTYPVTVVVEDDGQGNLTAAVSYEQGAAPVFTNTYQKPEGPLSFITGGDSDSSSGSAVVKTGDATLVLAAVLAAVAGLAIAIAALAGGKGRNRKK